MAEPILAPHWYVWGHDVLVCTSPQRIPTLLVLERVVPRHRDLRHLERDIAAVADHLRADLDQLLPERGQRPVLDLLWQRQ